MANAPIKNTKLLEEAFDAGYYRGLQEQGSDTWPIPNTPNLTTGSAPQGEVPYMGPAPHISKYSTAALGRKGGGQDDPMGYIPPIGDLPLPLGEGGNLAQWFAWFMNAFQSGWILHMSMPPQLANLEQYGWPHLAIVAIQEAFDALTALLYPIDPRTGLPLPSDYDGWFSVDTLLALIANMGQNQTPPYNPEG